MLGGGIWLAESFTVNGKLNSTDGVVVAGDMSAMGNITITNGLTVTNGLTTSGSLVVEGGLVVGPNFVEPGAVIVGTYLVTDSQELTRGLKVLGSLIVEEAFTVAGGASVTKRTRVSGNLSIRGKQTQFDIYLPFLTNNNPRTSNGDFEQGPFLWEQFSSANQPLIRAGDALAVPPHNGWWAAHLGVYDHEIAMISQGVTIYKNQTCLSYWEWVRSADACDADYGGIGIDGKWYEPRSLCAGTSTGQWVQRFVDMSDRLTTTKSSTFVLNFAVVNDYSVPSTMYIDDVLFTADEGCGGTLPSDVHASAVIGDLIGKPIGEHQ